MGRNNQQRRAAKARAKARDARARRANRRDEDDHTFGAQGGQWGVPPDWPSAEEPATVPSTRERAASCWDEALHYEVTGQPGRARAASVELGAMADSPGGRRLVTTLLVDRLTGAVTGSWERGWRPGEVHRLLSRDVRTGALAVLCDAMAAQLARHATASVAPDWFAQLEDIGADVWWSGDTTFIDAHALLNAGGLSAVVTDAVAAAAALSMLPAIPLLDPLPGSWQPTSHDAPDVDERILERVRALLAKAESTTFEAEAEAFTAGAQALMARHSIDAAMLAAARPRRAGDAPVARRVGIDRPYEAPKVLLLDAVARANRCRAVWSKDLAFVTVVGFDADARAVETLFTSLQVQATRAVAGAGARRAHTGQSRTRAFRSSFLSAFAHRIGERLQQATDEVTEEALGETVGGGGAGAAPGHDLVLVLAERSAEVDASVDELFPGLVSRSLGGATDPEGWHAGRRAADAAELHTSKRLPA